MTSWNCHDAFQECDAECSSACWFIVRIKIPVGLYSYVMLLCDCCVGGLDIAYAYWILHSAWMNEEINTMFTTRLLDKMWYAFLTHWGRVTHICVSKLNIIGSGNGLSPKQHQAIIWTNAGIFSIGHWGIQFNDIFIKLQNFSLNKMHLKMLSGKCWPFFLGLNVLTIA